MLELPQPFPVRSLLLSPWAQAFVPCLGWADLSGQCGQFVQKC